MVEPERISPNNDTATLLLLLLLKLLQLPIDSYGEFTIGKKHVHGHIGIPQACLDAMRMSDKRRMGEGDLEPAACGCGRAWHCCNETPWMTGKRYAKFRK